MINVADIITDPMFAQTMTVRRAAGSFNEYGEWVGGTSSEFTCIGSFQKATDLDLAQLDVGEIKTEIRKLLTPTEIKVSIPDDSQSDRIIWRGRRFKVIRVSDNQDYGFFRAFCAYEGEE